MVMTIEKTDEPFMRGYALFPTGRLKVVELRPATRLETFTSWWKGLFHTQAPNKADIGGLHLPMGEAVSVGIQLSADTYAKLINGDTKAVEALDFLRDQPVSMSLVVAPECAPQPSLEEMEATVV